MSIFSSYKKIFLLGFIVVILLAIPFTVYIAQKRQQTKTQATKSTILSFEPTSPTVKVGETLTLDVMLDPGVGSSANQVSIVKLSITFDKEKFTTEGASLEPSPNSPSSPNTLTTILEGPTFDAGKTSIFLSIGADPTKVVVTKTKIAVLKLKTINTATSTTVSFDEGNTQVLSIASSDQTSENVLSTSIPANVNIVSLPEVTPTSQPSNPNPTAALGQPQTPTSPPSFQSGSSSFGSNIVTTAPVCSNLNINGLTTGTAPYTLTFTAIGSDSDGTISKISFNFGDTIEDLLSGGGIGTSSVNGQISHTYNTPGTYAAYAILTDNNGNLSTQQDNCTRTITIGSNLGTEPNPTIVVQQPLPPTGEVNTMFGLGILGTVFAVIGAAFFILF